MKTKNQISENGFYTAMCCAQDSIASLLYILKRDQLSEETRDAFCEVSQALVSICDALLAISDGRY